MGKMMTAAVLPAVSVALIGCSRRQDVAATCSVRHRAGRFGGEQRLAAESTGLIYSNSISWARNIPVGIAGTTDGGFMGYISDNYDQHKSIVEYGFQSGGSAVDSTLRDGGTALIVYEMAGSGNRD